MAAKNAHSHALLIRHCRLNLSTHPQDLPALVAVVVDEEARAFISAALGLTPLAGAAERRLSSGVETEAAEPSPGRPTATATQLLEDPFLQVGVRGFRGPQCIWQGSGPALAGFAGMRLQHTAQKSGPTPPS